MLCATLQAQLGWGVGQRESHGRQGGASTLKGEVTESPFCSVPKPYRQKRKGRMSQAEGRKEVATHSPNSSVSILEGVPQKPEVWGRCEVKMGDLAEATLYVSGCLDCV